MRRIDGDVLLVVDTFPKRSQTFIVNEFQALVDSGVNVWLLAVSGVDNALLRQWPQARALANRVIRGNPVFHRRLRFLTDIISRARVHRALRRKSHHITRDDLQLLSAFARVGKFRVIHYQFAGLPRRAINLKLPHHAQSRLVVSVRGKDITTIPPQKRAAELAPLVEHADLFLPVCRRFAEVLTRDCSTDPGRVHVHYSGIDTSFFRVGEEVTRARRQSPVIRVYTAGRMTRKKGVPQSLEAFALAHQKALSEGIDLVMVVAGNGPQLEVVRETVRALGIDSLVTLTGAYNLDEHHKRLNDSHIFVSHNITPDNGDQEGIPNSLKEAMAAELPVLATRHSGIPELVDHERTGFLVEECDTQAMADCIVALARDVSLRESMGETGRDIVCSRFDIHTTSQQLVELYTGMLRG